MSKAMPATSSVYAVDFQSQKVVLGQFSVISTALV